MPGDTNVKHAQNMQYTLRKLVILMEEVIPHEILLWTALIVLTIFNILLSIGVHMGFSKEDAKNRQAVYVAYNLVIITAYLILAIIYKFFITTDVRNVVDGLAYSISVEELPLWSKCFWLSLGVTLVNSVVFITTELIYLRKIKSTNVSSKDTECGDSIESSKGIEQQSSTEINKH